MSDKKIAYDKLDEAFCEVARRDPNAFVEYVMKDEVKNKSVRLSPLHEEWHRAISSNKRVLIFSFIESGKSTNIAVGRVLYELGKNPNLRVAIVSNTYKQSVKPIRAIAKYIEQSEELHRVFPKLKPATPWTEGSITIERDTVIRDPSVQAVGVHGNVLGARLDLIILDDILDYENTHTPQSRQDLWDWYHATLAGRLTENGKVIAIGTAWHPEDIYHRFEKQDVWTTKRYSVLDDDGKPNWPSQWPLARIEDKRSELGPLEFARQMLCRARDDGEAYFKQSWINECKRKGEGLALSYTMPSIGPGCKMYTGVDLAVQKHSSADSTVFFTILVHPNGDRQVVNIESGKFSGPEIVDKIIETHKRYNSIMIVENVGSSDFILQFTKNLASIPLQSYTTGRGKASLEFQAQHLAAELGPPNHKWIIPNVGGKCHPEVDKWIEEMLYFDPSGHTGDRLAACLFARHGTGYFEQKISFFKLPLINR